MSNIPHSSDFFEGRWKGGWKSEVSSHTGELFCLITKKDENTYLTRYRAIYADIFSFEYTVAITIKREDGVIKFYGKEDLGWMAGGVYEYEGKATKTEFISTYRCESDHGTFNMTPVNGQ